MENLKIKLIKTPIHRYTFTVKPIRNWVEAQCNGRVLNLFAGPTKLSVAEIRNDIDPNMVADYHLDAIDFLQQWDGEKFDTIILDPPYSYRKSMELYNGHKASRFKLVKDSIPMCLKHFGKVITFGYQSVAMGRTRNFDLISLAIFNHGGATHDTVACVEQFIPELACP